MSISPLRNLDRKGCAYVVMLQQLSRALGVTVAVVRGKAKSTNYLVYIMYEVLRRRPQQSIDGKLGNREVVGIQGVTV